MFDWMVYVVFYRLRSWQTHGWASGPLRMTSWRYAHSICVSSHLGLNLSLLQKMFSNSFGCLNNILQSHTIYFWWKIVDVWKQSYYIKFISSLKNWPMNIAVTFLLWPPSSKCIRSYCHAIGIAQAPFMATLIFKNVFVYPVRTRTWVSEVYVTGRHLLAFWSTHSCRI